MHDWLAILKHSDTRHLQKIVSTFRRIFNTTRGLNLPNTAHDVGPLAVIKVVVKAVTLLASLFTTN